MLNFQNSPRKKSLLIIFGTLLVMGIAYMFLDAFFPSTAVAPENSILSTSTPLPTPERITIEGQYTCLPHRDTSGPTTLECALGLETERGFYALNTSVLQTDIVPQLATRDSITVSGTLLPIDAQNLALREKYDIRDIILVSDMKKQGTLAPSLPPR